jgi:uncharacterized membrane protein YecN with MAPEG domain
MDIAILYAALLTALYIVLSARVIRLRRALQIGIGDAGNKELARAMRVHANFAEYAPLALLLLVLVEGQGAHPLLMHGLGLLLLLGRAAHAFGVSQSKENLRFRVAGMVMTFSTLAAASVYLLFAYVRHVVFG